MQHSSLLRLVVVILMITAGIATAAPARKKKSSAPSKALFSLGGERLPIMTLSDWGDVRNERWQDIARVLRVRDLRVYEWPTAYNVAGGAEKQQRKTLAQLKAAGYKVEAITWRETDGTYPPPLLGFRARRGKETLSALWANNGSHLFLYWGHEVPLTPALKREDDLIQAVAEGDADKVEMLLKQGADPRALDYGGDSVLVLATAGHHAKIVEYLLVARKAASPQVRSVLASSVDIAVAMNLAAANDDVATLQVFLNGDATPAQIGKALYFAASYGAVKAARLLAPKAPVDSSVGSALVKAAFVEMWRGSPIQYPAIVELLLPYKPPQSALDAALVAAAEDDEANVVPMLLAAGANVEARNSRGDTALLRAAADPHYNAIQPAVQALLKAGANPNVRDKDGNTALFIAVTSNGVLTVEFLLTHGADPQARNNEGKTALDWAQALTKTGEKHRKRDYLAIVQLLRTAEAQNSKPK